MIRTTFVVSVLLLAIPSIGHAGDRRPASTDPVFQQRLFHSVDRQVSSQEYKELYRHNQKYVRDTLRSYSEQALVSIGIPEKTVNYMGAALGLVTNGAKLDLNESRTLAIELKDVGTQERALYFGVNLDW